MENEPLKLLAQVEDIWGDDLLGRRADADAVQSFLVSRSAALTKAGRPGAFALAIDGEYGSGKSYLLHRLYRQTQLSHPAAFIDAWADDTIDAPWTALLVALEEALRPFAPMITDETRAKLKGRGVKLVTALAKGAAKKGASYIVGEEGWNDAIDAVFEKEGEARIDAYQERRKAIRELQETLKTLMLELEAKGSTPPLFIFVDELDRCRPTYAVRFLEEIKHIFDVPGVVFVMAVHGRQLTKAISALYGTGFDGQEYLRRFIDKSYELHEPEMVGLVRYHIDSVGLDVTKFGAPPSADGHHIADFISKSLTFWSTKPRDAIRLIDSLATIQAIWSHPVPLRLELLLPLVLSSVLNTSKEELDKRINHRRVPTWPYPGRGSTNYRNPKELFEAFWSNKGRNFYFFQDATRRFDIGGAIARVLEEEHLLRAPLDPNEKSLLSAYPRVRTH